MKQVRFCDLEQFLKTGREIEFVYNGKHYSITNDSTGYWNFCLDEAAGSVLLKTLCPYRELEYLAEIVADTVIDGLTIRQIFDELLYDESLLWIL